MSAEVTVSRLVPRAPGLTNMRKPLVAGVMAVESTPLYAEGLASIVKNAQELQWKGFAVSLDAAQALCCAVNPDIVLVDGTLDRRCLLVKAISAMSPRSVLIVLWDDVRRRDSAQQPAALFAAGAHAVIARNASPARLVQMIRKARAVLKYVDPNVLSRISSAMRSNGFNDPADSVTDDCENRPSNKLTPREHEVLCLLTTGMTNSRIASTLHVSTETIRSHVKSLLRKLKAEDRAHAVALAYQGGILEFSTAPGWSY